jgi:heat shock protein HtpX
MTNYFKTFLLLAVLSALLVFIGSFWGAQGATFALIMAVILNFVSYFFSDKIALSMYRAKQVSREEAPQLYAIVEGLVARAELPMPRIYIIPEDSPNAFATGRNPQHSAVAVTQGIMRILSREELEGVIAHELAHVKNRDILISSIAATIAGAVMWISSMARWAAIFGGGSRDRDDNGGALGMIFAMIVAPFAAMLVQMAVSRSREYGADATGAGITGNPYALANALRKISDFSKKIPMEASPATAHMFIIHPFSGGAIMNLFSTHPPVEKRIERLTGRQLG